jgi:hypothetical protein
MTLAGVARTPSGLYAPSPVNEAGSPRIWSSKGQIRNRRHRRCPRLVLPRRSGQCRRPARCAVCAITSAGSRHAFRSTTPRRSFKPCAVPPTDARSDVNRGRATSSVPVRRQRAREGKIETKQAHEGTVQAFGLPPGRQNIARKVSCRHDRQGRTVRSTAAWSVARPVKPRCLVPKPDRHATALVRGTIVFRLMPHPMRAPRDVGAASGIGFERHGGHPMPGNGNGPSTRAPTPPASIGEPVDESPHNRALSRVLAIAIDVTQALGNIAAGQMP